VKINKQDIKGFAIGVVASISAVIIWDIIKRRYGIFNYTKEKGKELGEEIINIENEIR
jgi:hypothetical protein